MNSLFNTLITAVRAKFKKLYTKLRYWLQPAYWTKKLTTLFRKFFSTVFNVKPKDKKDYYPMLRWLVSKRLAFAIVIVLGVVSLFYLYTTLPDNFFSGESTSISTYKYNAIPLKFYEGTVRILAEDGYLAYEGEVADAQCIGTGTLYNAQGGKVYEGDFANDKYNGVGTLYYNSGAVRYIGDFVDNVYQGTGTAYRSTGAVEYTGDFISGYRNGQGTLYNATAKEIYSGTFLMDDIVYAEFLDKSTTTVAQMYTGATEVYSTDYEYAVTMSEIDAVYSATDGSASLDGNWIVDGIYVLSSDFPVAADSLTTINQLTAYFGTPDYFGVAWVNLPEAVTLNLLAKSNPDLLGSVSMSMTTPYQGVNTVQGYDQDHQVYIYTYIQDGLLYTFYTTGAGQTDFVMYAIEVL